MSKIIRAIVIVLSIMLAILFRKTLLRIIKPLLLAFKTGI